MFTSAENYRLIMWGVPVVTILHNMEEALLMSDFMEEYNRLIPDFTGNMIGLITFESLLFVLVVTAMLPLLFVWYSDIESHVNVFEILLYCFAFAMLINLSPHAWITLLSGSYSPGLASSFFLVLPAVLFLFFSALRQKRLSPLQWVIVIIGGILLHGPGLLGLLAIGNAIW